MKTKHTTKWLLLALCFYTMHVFGQQSLRSERNAYRAGDRIVKQQVEFKDPGSAGKNLTWDFSMLQPINENYTLDYFIPDSTRMDTLCGMEHNTRYYYYQKRDSLWAIGFENSTTLMEYKRPELKLRFPFSYGDTLRSNFEGTGQYSHRLDLKVKGYTRVEANAEGELLLPDFETVKRSLRVHTLRYYTQTGRDSIEMTLDTYSWYAEGIRYPVFESIKTNLIKKARKQGEQNRDTTVFSTSFYYPPDLQTSQVQTDPLPENPETLQGVAAVFTEATMLPNPVVSNLYINYKLTRPAQIWFSVHNNIGIPLRQTTPQAKPVGYNYATIPLSNIMTGTYTVYVHVDEMVLQKVVVKK
ncbi:MAG: hypothetical protein Q7U47_15660 [Paludibacter sp.]|nr:hypothetical protein [Paludibacter sp.]